MFKRWFESPLNGNNSVRVEELRAAAEEQTLAIVEPPQSKRFARSLHCLSNASDGALLPDDAADFEQIYLNASVKPPQTPCGILKVVEMVNSQHLTGLSPDAKHCAVLMALDTVGVTAEVVLQDAVIRQRALNDYETEQEENLRRFKERKMEDNRKIQAELESLTAEYMARVQQNVDQVAVEQDRFRAWQKKKQQEAQRIADAAAFCVAENMNARSINLTTVLERASAARG